MLPPSFVEGSTLCGRAPWFRAELRNGSLVKAALEVELFTLLSRGGVSGKMGSEPHCPICVERRLQCSEGKSRRAWASGLSERCTGR